MAGVQKRLNIAARSVLSQTEKSVDGICNPSMVQMSISNMTSALHL
jgi:hypothetical protein